MSTITIKDIGWTDTLVAVECGNCHIPFGIPSNLHYWAQKDGRSFWCPNGHRIWYSETENQRLKREAEQLRQQRDAARLSRDAARDQAEAAERRRRAAKGQLTKVQKRVANGVCPCCTRTFADLARHMSTKHPAYTERPKP